jgi:hypothetical protein
MRGDLRNPRWMYLKAIGLVVIGVLACTILLLRDADLQTLLLLLLAIWAFCRAYYFAFYVIEHYIDPTYKFAGLIDFAKYLFFKSRRTPGVRHPERSEGSRDLSERPNGDSSLRSE